MARSRNKPSYKPSATDRASIEIVVKAINECKRWHEPFVRKVEKRYSAYRGMSADEAPAGWRSNVTQPLLINIVEGMLASMEEAEPTWEAVGRIVPGMGIEEAVAQSDRAEFCAALVADQMRRDEFASKQAPFMLQDLIAGYTPGKVTWLRKRGLKRYYEEEREMITDDYGGTIDYANKLNAYEEDILVRDDPTFEPRDVRDFMWPESAVSVDAAPYVIDRTFVTFKTLKLMESLEIYEDVDFLDETRTPDEEQKRTQSASDIVKEREKKLRNVDRTRGLVEIVEYWTDEEVITLGNRTVLLRRKRNPHWHGYKPFVVGSAIPDSFQIPGISVIEGLAQMQEMLWTLQNTRLDATRMAANLIKVIRRDVEDAETFEWAPNADWFVRTLDDVKLLEIPTDILRATLESEGLLRGDIQGVMGALPFQGGAQSQTFDPKTATGMSIVTNIAQAVLSRRKQMYARTFSKLGGMFLSLDQQMLQRDRLVEILGPGGARRFIEVGPMGIKGFYDLKITWKDDSLMRQEKRAESGSMLTNAAQLGPVSAQMGVRLNMKKFWTRYLHDFGETNPEEFFLEDQPSQLMGPEGAPGTPQQAGSALEQMQGDLNGGVTNALLAAGPTAPSNPNSMSGAEPMQRMLATNGNAGQSI
jgi:hypothetical protein